MEYKREIEEVTGEVYVLVNGKKYVKSKKRHKLILTLIIAVIYTEVKFKLKKLGNKGKRELMVLDVDNMEYIQLKTKEQFKEVMKKYNKNWKLYMWGTFRENTCYLPSENYFISLDKAEKL